MLDVIAVILVNIPTATDEWFAVTDSVFSACFYMMTLNGTYNTLLTAFISCRTAWATSLLSMC